MARTVKCIKLGIEAEGLEFAPYPGELGKKVWESISKEAWGLWLKHQTMLINENRLNLADSAARKYLAEQMEKHFFGAGADKAAGYVPPKKCFSSCSARYFLAALSARLRRFSLISMVWCLIHCCQASLDTLSQRRLPNSPG